MGNRVFSFICSRVSASFPTESPSLFYGIHTILFKNCIKDSAKNIHQDKTVHILQYINEHFSESDLNINTVADIFGYHRVSLARLLKKKTNLTFSEHLLNARMRAALAMMQLGEQSVKHIAYSVGYTNPLYFTTQFTQLYGESPKKL